MTLSLRARAIFTCVLTRVGGKFRQINVTVISGNEACAAEVRKLRVRKAGPLQCPAYTSVRGARLRSAGWKSTSLTGFRQRHSRFLLINAAWSEVNLRCCRWPRLRGRPQRVAGSVLRQGSRHAGGRAALGRRKGLSAKPG